ncbi:MAG: hydrogen peroxide-inducible genes activator, partial [Rhodobacteraceae bacterium]|nr:hydrogen peroxide-inducible genes activator [Paracoccaceae bacterium]
GRDAVQLRRFTGVEPKRQIGLLRRETSLDGDWGADLCRVLSDAGQAAVARARASF